MTLDKIETGFKTTSESHVEFIERDTRSERFCEIITYAHERLPNITQEARERLIAETMELYDCTQEFVAPVITAFSNNLLRGSSDRGGATVIYAARDGLGSYLVSKALLEKFPDRYDAVGSEQLVYAYLTRKVVWDSSRDTLRRYFAELGVPIEKEIVLADVGMYGSILEDLDFKVPEYRITAVEYLISRTSKARGFLDDGHEHQLPVFRFISGNPAVHFLEDTYSGSLTSPEGLEDVDGRLQPDTLNSGYEPEVAIKREFALKALEDYAAAIEDPDEVSVQEAKIKLNEFLSDTGNFRNLMVPHER